MNSHTTPKNPKEEVKREVVAAIAPLKPPDQNTRFESSTLLNATRTEAGRDLPPYYLVYFLLVELLEFPNQGQWEKTAWSVPVDWKGHGFLLEYKKFGLGIFAQKPELHEADAREVANRIQKAVKIAEPFFDHLADEAVARSEMNVVNNAKMLYGRYKFLRDTAKRKQKALERERADSPKINLSVKRKNAFHRRMKRQTEKRYHSQWLTLSAVEAFFAWTEHVLILVALITNRISTASEVSSLAQGNWDKKFKSALSVKDRETKAHYDRLMALRNELRNHVAHGTFGKDGAAYYFHSKTGAVPVLLPHKSRHHQFKLGDDLHFDESSAITAMDEFALFLWSGERKPAKLYIQESELPIILTSIANGTYAKAMSSVKDMKTFIDYLTEEFDRAANMDW
jgi:hypothetical protein